LYLWVFDRHDYGNLRTGAWRFNAKVDAKKDGNSHAILFTISCLILRNYIITSQGDAMTVALFSARFCTTFVVLIFFIHPVIVKAATGVATGVGALAEFASVGKVTKCFFFL
jgi:hypothetical protein